MKQHPPLKLFLFSFSLFLVIAWVFPAAGFEGMGLYTHGSLWGAGTIRLAVLDASGNTVSDNEIYSGLAVDAKFSPDGSKVAFIRSSDKKVIVMDLDGSNQQTIGTASGDITYGLASWRHKDSLFYTGDTNLKVYNFATKQIKTAYSGSQSFRELDISVNLRGVHGGMPPYYAFDLVNGWDREVLTRCGGSISPNGKLVTNMWADHKGFDIKNWSSWTVSKGVKTSTGLEALDPQFSGNSNNHVLCNDGGKNNFKPYVYKISSGTWKKIGSPSGNNHATDFWSGSLLTATAATPSITPSSRQVVESQITLTINCSTSGAQIRYTTDGSAPTESHGSILSPGGTFNMSVPSSGQVVVKAIAHKSGMNTSSTATETYTRTNLRNPDNPSDVTNGLNYQYFEDSWQSLPDFSVLTAKKTGSTDNFDISVADLDDYFAILFKGYINIESDGLYTFYTVSDDGSKLWIGNTQVVDNDGMHGEQERSGMIGLKAGKHAITVAYFEDNSAHTLAVRYEGGSVSRREVPASALYRDKISSVPPITLSSPNGGTIFTEGDTVDIIWTTDTAVVDNVTLEISTNNGMTWASIRESSVLLSAPEWGLFQWVIPTQQTNNNISLVSENCKIRVSNYKGTENDFSDSEFTIKASSTEAILRGKGANSGRPVLVKNGSRIRFSTIGSSLHSFTLTSVRGNIIHRGKTSPEGWILLPHHQLSTGVYLLRIYTADSVQKIPLLIID